MKTATLGIGKEKSKGRDMPKNGTSLTERQIEVLKLKKEGLSQVEIARKFGTTRANVCATEKTAHRNITKAKNTLEVIKGFDASFWISILPETDINDAVREVYQKADERGLWIMHNFPSLLTLVLKSSGDRIRGRRILSPIEIGILEDGSVTVR